jgi:hypothetical protein
MNFNKISDWFLGFTTIMTFVAICNLDFISPAVILFGYFLLFDGFYNENLLQIVVAPFIVLLTISYQTYCFCENTRNLSNTLAYIISALAINVGLFFVGRKTND